MMEASGLERLAPRDRRALEVFLRALERELALDDTALAIALIDDAEMRALNRVHRGKDYATDVLSFPVEPGLPPPFDRRLGDLAVSVDTARVQARALGHATAIEIAVLVIHGLTHLLGHDHEEGRAAALAQAELELHVANRVGVPLAATLIGRAIG